MRAKKKLSAQGPPDPALYATRDPNCTYNLQRPFNIELLQPPDGLDAGARAWVVGASAYVIYAVRRDRLRPEQVPSSGAGTFPSTRTQEAITHYVCDVLCATAQAPEVSLPLLLAWARLAGGREARLSKAWLLGGARATPKTRIRYGQLEPGELLVDRRLVAAALQHLPQDARVRCAADANKRLLYVVETSRTWAVVLNGCAPESAEKDARFSFWLPAATSVAHTEKTTTAPVQATQSGLILEDAPRHRLAYTRRIE